MRRPHRRESQPCATMDEQTLYVAIVACILVLLLAYLATSVVSRGKRDVVLLAGPSGAGKTVLLQQVSASRGMR